MILGNDISVFQGDVDYDTLVKNANFVIIRSSYGNGYIDAKFSRNQSEARRVGLARGYYHYCYPQYNTAHDEALWFLKVVGQLQEGESLYLDFEEHYTGDVVGWCHDFLDTVFHNCGVRPLIYLNQSLVSGYNWQPVVDAGYGLWIAAYTFDPNNNNFVQNPWPVVAMQQWTDKQEVPGISGGVDGDCFFGDIQAFKAYGYQVPVAEPVPTPPSTPSVPPVEPPVEPPTPPATPPVEPVPPVVPPVITPAQNLIVQFINWLKKVFGL